MSTHLLDAVAEEIAKLLDPLAGAVENPYAFDQLLAELGAKTPAIGDDRETLIAALTAVLDLQTQIEALVAQPSPSLGSIAALLDLLRQAFAAVRALRGFGAATDAFAGLGEDLVTYLVASYLRRWHPLAHSLASLATLIEPAHEQEPRVPVIRDDELLRDTFSLDRFRFGRLVDLMRDPVATLRADYGSVSATTDDANRLARKLFPRLQRVLRVLGVPCRYGFDPDDTELLGDTAPFLENALIIYVQDVLAGAAAESGVVLNVSPADRGDLGLVISPFGTLTITKEVGTWSIELNFTGDIDVLAYGRHGLTLLADPTTAEVKGSISATLPAPEQGPAFLLGAPKSSRLEVGGAQLKLETSLSEAQQSLELSADVSSSAIVIAPGDGDGFLRSILPAEGMQAKFDLGLAWSTERGLTLRGSASLDAMFPIGLSLGGVTLHTVHVSLQAHDASLLAEMSTTLGVSIGPANVAIERVGLAAAVTFPETGGNLGVADLDFRFKPPNGIGLGIDAKAVTGAGYLDFYPERGEYIGAAQLRIKDKINVKAIGIILTKPEFSFLLMVSAEFPPVQLGLGFKLNGVGGLVGIHRGINEERLFAGLRDNTLDDILFPEDPIKNIHGLIGKLNGVFPPTKGQYTFGLMGLITWGPKDLVTIELGLIVEFPTSFRLAVVGTLKAAVTKEIEGKDVSILQLQVNFAGLFDFDEQFIRFDAALYQSKLFGFTLEGEMALRIKYGANPDFVMTLGGFHPDFQPPALRLPADLRRLQITLRSGNPHIWIDTYLAVTANTIQFGAGGHLRFSKWEVSVSGDLGFDALFQFIPFRFEAGAYFYLKASWKGHDFASIEIDGVFSGPSPWRIRGQFKLKICWFLKISVAFDESWGDDDPTLLGLIDVLPLLVEDLRAPANWERTPGRTRLLVTARQSLQVHQNEADLWLHPNDLLTVRQNTVPLGLHIDKFSEKRPQGASRFKVKLKATDDGTTLLGTPVKNHFAPSQFFHRSDEEKLSSKSYELFEAGAAFEGLDSVVFDAWSGQEVTYEIDYVDDPAVEPQPEPQPAPPQAESLQDFEIAVRNNTLANSAIARRARPKAASTPDRITEQYVVADQATLAMHENMVTDSETEARLLLRELVRKDPRKARELTVLLRSETL